MADFILFEVHLHDGFEFSPASSTPFLSKGIDALTDTDDESYDDYDVKFDVGFDTDENDGFDGADDAESGDCPELRLLVGPALLVGVAAATRCIRGSDNDLDELVDLDDTDDEERGEVEVDAWTDDTEHRLLWPFPPDVSTDRFSQPFPPTAPLNTRGRVRP